MLTAILLAIIWIGTTFFLDPMIKQWIEENGSEAFSGQVTVQKVRSLLFPLKVDLYGVSINKTNDIGDKIKISIDSASATLDTQKALQKNYAFDIKITKPIMQLTQNPKPKPPKPLQRSIPFANVYSALEQTDATTPLSLKLNVENGSFLFFGTEQTFEATQISFDLNIPALKSEWSVLSSGELDFKNYNLKIPFSANAGVSLNSNILQIKNSNLTFAGIDSHVNGDFNIDTKMQNWHLSLKAPQIESLKAPFNLACMRLATGSLDLESKITKSLTWTASGHVLAQKVSGQTKCQIKDAIINGPFTFNSDISFNWNDNLSFDKFLIQADLSNLDIKYKNLFSKPLKKTFALNINGSINNKVFILNAARIQLDQMSINSQGTLNFNSGNPSNITASLNKSSLTGTEELFPLLKGFPVQGYLEFSSQIKGDLTRPDSLSIEINPFVAQNVRTNVTWKSDDESSSINGPLLMNLKGVLKSTGVQLQQADILANLDLTNISLKTQSFNKPQRAPLKFDLLAQQIQNKIYVKKGTLKLPGGEIFMSGNLSNIFSPLLDLQFKAQNLQLQELLKLNPVTAQYKLSGKTTAQFKLLGHYNFKDGIEKSPLTLSGSASTHIQNINIQSKRISNVTDTKPDKPEPLAPNWPLVKNMNLNLNFNIDSVKYDDLPINGIQSHLQISNGMLNSKGSIKSLFGGNIFLKKLSVSLLNTQPTTDISAKVQNMQMQNAMNWLFPQGKDLISGSANGDFIFKVAHPNSSNFISTTSGSGSFKIKNGFLSTLPIDQLVNDKLSKIPILTQQNHYKINTKGMRGNIDGAFKYAEGKIYFSSFHILTPEKNELTGSGWVSADKTLDINSKVFLTNVPIKGSVFEANSDSQKRFILPIHIKGGILSPEIDITQDTINILVQNTARYEGNKLKHQVTNDVLKKANELKDELQKKAGDQFKKIFQ